MITFETLPALYNADTGDMFQYVVEQDSCGFVVYFWWQDGEVKYGQDVYRFENQDDAIAKAFAGMDYLLRTNQMIAEAQHVHH